MKGEIPGAHPQNIDISRRRFLYLLAGGASLALVGCSSPDQEENGLEPDGVLTSVRVEVVIGDKKLSYFAPLVQGWNNNNVHFQEAAFETVYRVDDGIPKGPIQNVMFAFGRPDICGFNIAHKQSIIKPESLDEKYKVGGKLGADFSGILKQFNIDNQGRITTQKYLRNPNAIEDSNLPNATSPSLKQKNNVITPTYVRLDKMWNVYEGNIAAINPKTKGEVEFSLVRDNSVGTIAYLFEEYQIGYVVTDQEGKKFS